jgi:hypothetical protein
MDSQSHGQARAHPHGQANQHGKSTHCPADMLPCETRQVDPTGAVSTEVQLTPRRDVAPTTVPSSMSGPQPVLSCPEVLRPHLAIPNALEQPQALPVQAQLRAGVALASAQPPPLPAQSTLQSFSCTGAPASGTLGIPLGGKVAGVVDTYSSMPPRDAHPMPTIGWQQQPSIVSVATNAVPLGVGHSVGPAASVVADVSRTGALAAMHEQLRFRDSEVSAFNSLHV